MVEFYKNFNVRNKSKLVKQIVEWEFCKYFLAKGKYFNKVFFLVSNQKSNCSTGVFSKMSHKIEVT